MKKKTGVVLLLIVVAIAACEAFGGADYCNVTCNKGYGVINKHTVCLYPSPDRCEQLGYTDIKYGLTEEEKNIIVKMHNEFRQKVASGKETRGLNRGQPAAKEMKEIKWDDELEFIAQRWTGQCISSSRGELTHDDCRSKIDGERVGQNAAEATGWGSELKVEDYIVGWFDEVEQYDGNNAYKVFGQRSTRNSDHYTQVVNAKTDSIGCGAVRYTDGRNKKLYIFCNYSPTGNIKSEQVYIPIDSKEEPKSENENNNPLRYRNHYQSGPSKPVEKQKEYHPSVQYPEKHSESKEGPNHHTGQNRPSATNNQEQKGKIFYFWRGPPGTPLDKLKPIDDPSILNSHWLSSNRKQHNSQSTGDVISTRYDRNENVKRTKTERHWLNGKFVDEEIPIDY